MISYQRPHVNGAVIGVVKQGSAIQKGVIIVAHAVVHGKGAKKPIHIVKHPKHDEVVEDKQSPFSSLFSLISFSLLIISVSVLVFTVFISFDTFTEVTSDSTITILFLGDFKKFKLYFILN